MSEKQAVVGSKPCGCVVAVDLDGKAESDARYKLAGYTVSRMGPEEAKRLLWRACWHEEGR